MINRVVLVGRLVRDPELRKTVSGIFFITTFIGPSMRNLEKFTNQSVFGTDTTATGVSAEAGAAEVAAGVVTCTLLVSCADASNSENNDTHIIVKNNLLIFQTSKITEQVTTFFANCQFFNL